MRRGLEKALYLFAKAMNEEAKKELTPAYGVATGKLKNSLSFSIERGFAGRKEIVFYANGESRTYAQYVHYGVSGTEQKRPNTPFRYKDKAPPSNVIADWIVTKGIRLRDKKGRFMHIRGVKGKKNVQNVAYLMAQSIKRKGLKGVFYYNKAYKRVIDKYEPWMTKEMKNIVENRIKARFDNYSGSYAGFEVDLK